MSNHLVYLSLGTNLGNKEENLQNALKLLEEQVGNIVSQSALYASSPWGFVSENSFLNCVIAINKTFSPQELLSITQHIELSLGRTHKTINGQYSDRLIDIDILFYDSLVMDTPALTLPHPLLHQRLFVLSPLAEIASTLRHPILQKTIHTLHHELLAKEQTPC
jgi:2-amino-4-hydroxy-6-hydroxymethyldihydropteridine diphosphokinase